MELVPEPFGGKFRLRYWRRSIDGRLLRLRRSPSTAGSAPQSDVTITRPGVRRHDRRGAPEPPSASFLLAVATQSISIDKISH